MTAVTKIRTDEVALRKARMLIGGKWVDSASGEMLEVEDPAHRRPIAEVPRGSAEDVARAVRHAGRLLKKRIPVDGNDFLCDPDGVPLRACFR